MTVTRTRVVGRGWALLVAVISAGVLECAAQTPALTKNRVHLATGRTEGANVAPTLDLNGNGAAVDFSATFGIGGPAVRIVDTDLSVTDDSNGLVLATIQLTDNLDGNSEVLAVVTTGTNIIATLGPAGATRTLTLTGFDSRLAYEQVLRSATYNNFASFPNTTQRVIEFRLNDGALQSAVATARVSLAPLLTLQSASSRKSHGAVGAFDINLPLAGAAGIEPRNTATATTHTLLFLFSNDVLSGSAAVTSGVGTVNGSPTFVGKTMTVQLTGVTNAQQIGVTLRDVTDNTGQVLPNTVVSMKVLRGDVNSSSAVNSGDATLTRNRSGEPTAFPNFRSDVNLDGAINGGDALIVKNASGTSVAADEP